MPRGGYRPGAGRKPTREKFKRPIADAEKRIADRLPELVDNLMHAADGGYERVTVEWAPAGLQTVEDVDFDDKGRPVRKRVPAFPHLDPAELVVVKRTVEIADVDVKANTYLLDRIMGKPAADVQLSGPDGGPIDLEVNDGSRLSDDKLAAAVDRILDRARARTAGAPDQPEPDLGTAAGPAA